MITSIKMAVSGSRLRVARLGTIGRKRVGGFWIVGLETSGRGYRNGYFGCIWEAAAQQHRNDSLGTVELKADGLEKTGRRRDEGVRMAALEAAGCRVSAVWTVGSWKRGNNYIVHRDGWVVVVWAESG